MTDRMECCDTQSSSSDLLRKLSSSKDGEVSIGHLSGCPRPVGLVLVGPDTLHPLKEAIHKSVHSDRFFVLFQPDPSLCSLAPPHNRQPEESSQVEEGEKEVGGTEELCRLSIIESVKEEGALGTGETLVVTTGGNVPLSEWKDPPSCLVADLKVKHKVVTQNMLPFGTMQEARELLALLFSQANRPDSSPDVQPQEHSEDGETRETKWIEQVPVLVATVGGGYVGQVLDKSAESYTVFSFSPGLDANNRQLCVEDLSAQFLQHGACVSSTVAKAWYDLLGSPTESGSCFCLVAEWKSQRNAPIRMLSPPALIPEQAVVIVRGSGRSRESFATLHTSHEGEESSLTTSIAPDKPLEVIESLLTMQSPLSNLKAVDRAWQHHVSEFLKAASNGSLFSRSHGIHQQQGDAEDDVDGLDQDLSDFGIKEEDLRSAKTLFTSRLNLDFTEHFWETIVVRSRTLQDILFGLQALVQALRGGELLPYIHKTNKTLLGSLCKQAIATHMSKSAGEQEKCKTSQVLQTYLDMFEKGDFTPKSQALVAENLARLGIWKLERDFVHWFNHIGIDESTLNEVLPAVGERGAIQSAQQRLVYLRNALQLTWTALHFRCPRLQAKALGLASLQFSKERLQPSSAWTEPTFVLPLNVQLPWVRDDAAGVTPLPTPKFWQLIQQDKQQALVQTTRLIPFCAQVLATSPLDVETARRVVLMIEKGESRSRIHRLLCREYQEMCRRKRTDSSSSTHSHAETLVKEVGLMQIMARTICFH